MMFQCSNTYNNYVTASANAECAMLQGLSTHHGQLTKSNCVSFRGNLTENWVIFYDGKNTLFDIHVYVLLHDLILGDSIV